jgi:magnesium transporter
MDRVVDDYAPVVAGLEHDIDEIESEVFGGKAGVSKRIYELSREVIEFQRATTPLVVILSSLIGEGAYQVDSEVRRYLRDVQDHALRVTEQVVGFREILQNILSVNLTLVSLSQNEEVNKLTQVSIEQNEEVKRISAWAAILFAPTLVGTIYGMNFNHMPELHWLLGYPLALVLMVVTSVSLYAVFKQRGWI